MYQLVHQRPIRVSTESRSGTRLARCGGCGQKFGLPRVLEACRWRPACARRQSRCVHSLRTGSIPSVSPIALAELLAGQWRRSLRSEPFQAKGELGNARRELVIAGTTAPSGTKSPAHSGTSLFIRHIHNLSNACYVKRCTRQNLREIATMSPAATSELVGVASRPPVNWLRG